MTKIKKVLIFILIACFISQDLIYCQPGFNSNLRVPLAVRRRLDTTLKAAAGFNSFINQQKLILSREEFRRRIFDIAVSYLAGQYNMPVYSGFAPEQAEKLFERYELSDSINDPSIVFEAIQLIMENNMRLNHMYLGHMLTTPLALPIFLNPIIDFINSNQADPEAEEVYQRIEYQAVQWLARIVGYGDEAIEGQGIAPGGIITSGGTTANMLALQLMRDTAIDNALKEAGIENNVRSIGFQRALELLGNREAVLFVSQEAHYSWQKIAGYEGIGSANVIAVRVDSQLRMDTEDLREKVEQAKKQGKMILGIMATVGTTETGNIDPVDKIHRIAKESGNNIWLHIDGAYGASCALSKDSVLREKMSHLRLADSVTIDPHKFLYMPYNLGALIVKDNRALEAIRPYFQGAGQGILAQGFIQERRFDSLKLWAALQWIGTDRLGEIIDHVNNMTKDLCEKIKQDEEFEILSVPEMDLFTFRYVPKQLGKQLKEACFRGNRKAINQINNKINNLTESIQKAMQASGMAWVSLTEMHNSAYTQYADRHEDPSFKLNALRVVAMNPFMSQASIEGFYTAIKNISAGAAFKQGFSGVTAFSSSRYTIPDTSAEYTFQQYFMHPATSSRLADLGARVMGLISNGQASAYTDTDVENFKAGLSDFNAPRNGIDEGRLVKKLAIIVDIARKTRQAKKIPETMMAAGLIYPSLNPNQIAWEVSPASTYAEAWAIKRLSELFGYKAYTLDLGGRNIDVKPGGIVTNSSTMAVLTAMLVARNAAMEKLLTSYNHRNPSTQIDAVKHGFNTAFRALKEDIARHNNSRMVIIASKSKADLIRELAFFIGMSPGDVIEVEEDLNGSVDADALRDAIKIQKSHNNIIMMIAVNLGGLGAIEARALNKVFRDFSGNDKRQATWIHGFTDTMFGRSYDPNKRFMGASMRHIHSVSIDTQSLFNMPFGIGITLFQNRALLSHYLKQSAPYVIRENEAGGMLNLSSYSPEGSKGFHALGLFLTILLYGRELGYAIHENSVSGLDNRVFDAGGTEPSLYYEIDRYTRAAINLLNKEHGNLKRAYKEKLDGLRQLFTDTLMPLKGKEFSKTQIEGLLNNNGDKIYSLINEIRDIFIKLQLIEDKDDSVFLYTLLTWQDVCTTGLCKYINNALRDAFIGLGFTAYLIPVGPFEYHYYVKVYAGNNRFAVDAASPHIFMKPSPYVIVEETAVYETIIEKAAAASALRLKLYRPRTREYIDEGTRFLSQILSSI